jgi:hypothetical protein
MSRLSGNRSTVAQSQCGGLLGGYGEPITDMYGGMLEGDSIKDLTIWRDTLFA